MTQIAVNQTSGYGYNYCSLADLANQGFKIPIMRTVCTPYGEYIEWYDSEQKEWYQGAKVETNVKLPKGNACQNYGAALAYARRYTVYMALGLATDDDKGIENPETVSAPTREAHDATLEVHRNGVRAVIEQCKKANWSQEEITNICTSIVDKPFMEMTSEELLKVQENVSNLLKESEKNG